MDKLQLCTLAVEAMKNAYAPYSGFSVGAALLSASGRVFLGCNIENAAYSATVCAERTAVFKAISEGEREFEMLAVVAAMNGEIVDSTPPCGVCRQVLAEFCQPSFPILAVNIDGSYNEYKLGDLLPNAFASNYLKGEESL